MFGIPPQLSRPIIDLASLNLRRSERRPLELKVRQLERQFPQIEIAIVFAPSVAPSPLAAYTFWLFNRSALFSAIDAGGENFGLLLVIDIHGSMAAAMTGYGLEPLLPDDVLDDCVSSTLPSLKTGDFSQAAAHFLASIETGLLQTHDRVTRAFGIRPDMPWGRSLREISNGATLENY